MVARAQNPQNYSVCRSMADRGLSCYSTESLTGVGGMFGECHTPCMLKASSVDSIAATTD